MILLIMTKLHLVITTVYFNQYKADVLLKNLNIIPGLSNKMFLHPPICVTKYQYNNLCNISKAFIAHLCSLSVNREPALCATQKASFRGVIRGQLPVTFIDEIY